MTDFGVVLRSTPPRRLWTIGGVLFGGFLALIALLTLFGAAAVVTLGGFSRSFDELRAVSSVLTVAGRVDRDMGGLRAETREYLADRSAARREAVFAQADRLSAGVAEARREAASEARAALLDEIDRSVAAYTAGLHEIVALVSRSDQRVREMVALGETMKRTLETVVQRAFDRADYTGSDRTVKLQQALQQVQNDSLVFLIRPAAATADHVAGSLAEVAEGFARQSRLMLHLDDAEALRGMTETVPHYGAVFAEVTALAASIARLEDTVLGAHGAEIGRLTDTLVHEAEEREGAVALEFWTLIDHARLNSALFAALALLVGIACAWVVVRNTVPPLRRITGTMTSLARGSLDTDVPIGHRLAEIDALARAADVFKRAMQSEQAARRDAVAARHAAETALHDLKVAQEFAIEAEKMASLGQLVAGVAHEINTPIGNALTATSHLGDRARAVAAAVEAGQVRKNTLTEFIQLVGEASAIVQANIGRAVELVQSFKRVAVDQTSEERRVFDLAAYIAETMMSLRPRLKNSPHRVVVDCPEGIQLDSYPGAIYQVVSNLVNNALVHAFDDGDAGTITIRVSQVDTATVAIRVADDGRGIPVAEHRRIFEPFYTTRRGAGGTGLGLHIVFNLVTTTLRGRVTVDSGPGRGATFIAVIPRSTPADPAKAQAKGRAVRDDQWALH